MSFYGKIATVKQELKCIRGDALVGIIFVRNLKAATLVWNRSRRRILPIASRHKQRNQLGLMTQFRGQRNVLNVGTMAEALVGKQSTV